MANVVTSQRFASGMTFDEYVKHIGTPENLAREGSGGSIRRDFSGFFREAFEKSRLTDAQLEALKWLRAQPGGPAKVLVISEDWSSDCRRDVPTLARMAAETGMELRIFRRDGQKFSAANMPSLAEAPDSNADLMAEFLKHSNGQTWQSIPVAVFYTDDLTFLYRYQEYAAIYHKDPVVAKIREPLAGESAADAASRTGPLFQALQDSAFFRVWASAAVDEMISALHRKLLLGEA
jgi:thiol-disulfide isomerase/thioredoxin